MNRKYNWFERVMWLLSFLVTTASCIFYAWLLVTTGIFGTYMTMILGIHLVDSETIAPFADAAYMTPLFILASLFYLYGVVVAIKAFIYYKSRKRNNNYAMKSLISLSFVTSIVFSSVKFFKDPWYLAFVNPVLILGAIYFVLVILALTLNYINNGETLSLSKLFQMISLPLILGGIIYYLFNYRLIGVYYYLKPELDLDIKYYVISTIFATVGFIVVLIYMMHTFDISFRKRSNSLLGILCFAFIIPCIAIAYIEKANLLVIMLSLVLGVGVTLNSLSFVLYKEDKMMEETLVTK